MSAEQGDGDEVADGHEPHEEVCHVPDGAEAGNGAVEYHGYDDDAVGGEYPGLFAEVLDVGFAVVVVAQHAAEGKEEDGSGNDDAAPVTDVLADGCLGELDAVHLVAGAHAADEDDEGGAGADDEGVAEDADGLYLTLLDGVGDISGGCYVGGGAHAGFVAVETAADALLDGSAYAARKPLFPAEGVGDDEAEDAGKLGDVHGDDDEGKGNVAQGHDGDDDAADAGDALDAAEDDDGGEQGEHGAHVGGGESEGFFKGLADGVALHGVEGEAEGEDEQDGEERTHPGLLETDAHVVRRTADEGLFAFYLVELGEGGFHKGAACAQESDEPHPEDGTGTAHGDGYGYAGEVAGAHAACDGDGKGLEGGNALNAFFTFLVCAVAEHDGQITQHGELHEFAADGEPDGAANEHGYEYIAPQDAVCPVDELCKKFHKRGSISPGDYTSLILKIKLLIRKQGTPGPNGGSGSGPCGIIPGQIPYLLTYQIFCGIFLA